MRQVSSCPCGVMTGGGGEESPSFRRASRIVLTLAAVNENSISVRNGQVAQGVRFCHLLISLSALFTLRTVLTEVPVRFAIALSDCFSLIAAEIAWFFGLAKNAFTASFPFGLPTCCPHIAALSMPVRIARERRCLLATRSISCQ